MKIQLKIISTIFLFLGYLVLLFVIIGLIAFWMYWQDHISIFSDFTSLQNNYNDYFSEYNLSPLQNLLSAIILIILGHGLLKLKWWAGVGAFIVSIYDLFYLIQDVFSGYIDTFLIIQILLTVYILVVLYGNKKLFQKNNIHSESIIEDE